MFLKNYTTDVPVSVTLHRIEQVLLEAGASAIQKEYGPEAKVLAVTFHIDTAVGKQVIRLPANEEMALEALWLDYVDGDELQADGNSCVSWSRKKKRKHEFIQQAQRTAWRIVKDWVEVQMSMIHLKQAELMQVFLPYLYDGKRTYYEALKDSKFAGLLLTDGRPTDRE